jgi:CO/xanthine dehydrogenase Mo-binding subunit
VTAYIGRPTRRVEDVRLITGRGRYAGESGTIPVPAAIANAVEDALRKRKPDGIVDRLPITSDRIVEMLGA